MQQLFCDGGCIKTNPSPYGGTWCWCLVEDKKILTSDNGVLSPKEAKLPKITNNVMELFAAVLALESREKDWNGVLHTDSMITKYRLTNGNSFNGVPQWLRVRTLDLRRMRKWSVELVGGHPTRLELEQGNLKKNGFPTSPFNVFCDKNCNIMAKLFLDEMNHKGEEEE